ncbi:hypothetical protein GBA52_022507 [Prunus armeniaca]|nr:hypothetical protein GBA52_022507 [Prunus armeniaca]
MATNPKVDVGDEPLKEGEWMLTFLLMKSMAECTFKSGDNSVRKEPFNASKRSVTDSPSWVFALDCEARALDCEAIQSFLCSISKFQVSTQKSLSQQSNTNTTSIKQPCLVHIFDINKDL